MMAFMPTYRAFPVPDVGTTAVSTALLERLTKLDGAALLAGFGEAAASRRRLGGMAASRRYCKADQFSAHAGCLNLKHMVQNEP
jgi:hypothetical protein